MTISSVIPLDSLKPGVILPAPIFDGNNPQLLLLGQGAALTVANIQRLKSRGVSKISIDSKHFGAVTGSAVSHENASQSKDPIKKNKKESCDNRPRYIRYITPVERVFDKRSLEQAKETKRQFKRDSQAMTDQLERFYDSLNNQGKIKGNTISNITAKSIEQMLSDIDIFVSIALRPQDSDCSHTHCMRVAQLAMSIAAVMQFSKENIKQLGMGCLISRSGMTHKIGSLMEEKRQLSEIELLEIKKIPMRTFNAVESLADIPDGARQVAYQIFERFNGSGYPRRRAGNQIHKLSRIASIADVFVALTSPRPHRSAFQPYRAVEIILEETKRGLFDPVALRGFLQTVSLFPIGSIVLLKDGRYARVMRTNSESYDRPIIAIYTNHDSSVRSCKMIDLAEDQSIEIASALSEEEATGLPDLDFLEIIEESNHMPQLEFCWDDKAIPNDSLAGCQNHSLNTPSDELLLAY